MQNEYKQLKSIMGEVSDLNSVLLLLSWDHQVNMPPGGAKMRGVQMSTIGKLAHIKVTAPEVGELLEKLKSHAKNLDPDSDEARTIKETSRTYDRLTKVPAEFVAEMTELRSTAMHAWQEARQESDFSKFEPYLEKIISLSRQYSDFFAPYDHPYDPLIDRFEPGMKTAALKSIFDELRPKQVALLKKIVAKPQVDDSFLHQEFDEDKQWEFGIEAVTEIGFDWHHGRQDKSTHPFTSNTSMFDVRITTRFDPGFFNTSFFATLHECGHGLYELGINPDYARTTLGVATSLGMHESQSRMWENLVGRSHDYWIYKYPKLQKMMPEQFADTDLEDFYRGINKAEPSLVRVEADEATYNLHIMLRFELELALIEGELDVNDLPDAWNSRMQEYLGITPSNDAEGVLQDIHWSDDSVGYFPTYTLGNIISVQLWEKIKADIPDLHKQIRRGEFNELLAWNREKIHHPGNKYEPQELVERVTGSKIDPQPYIGYLETKFGEIYGF